MTKVRLVFLAGSFLLSSEAHTLACHSSSSSTTADKFSLFKLACSRTAKFLLLLVSSTRTVFGTLAVVAVIVLVSVSSMPSAISSYSILHSISPTGSILAPYYYY